MGRNSVLSRNAKERTLLTIGASLFFVGAYFGVGLTLAPEHARTLLTTLDARIPFVPETVWIYLGVFPASLLPLFVVRCPRLFRRTIAAYGVAVTASSIMFALYPVTSVGLRVPGTALDLSRFSTWGVSCLYRLDPPYNLMPSLHLAIALLAAAATWKASRAYGTAALAGAVPIAVSIVTTKQHGVLDGAAGIALAALVYSVTLRTYEPQAGTDPAFDWRGPAAYLTFSAILFGAAYVGFLILS